MGNMELKETNEPKTINYEKLWKKHKKALSKYVERNKERIEKSQDDVACYWFYRGKQEFAEMSLRKITELEEKAEEKENGRED